MTNLKSLIINHKSFFLIILLALSLRLYGLNWDQSSYLHPDERAIVSSLLPLALPSNPAEFLSPASSWNPHFFPYGSFPLYLLKIFGAIVGIFDPLYSSYDGINLIGRIFSALFDTSTLILIFILGKKLFNQKVGFLASLFYALSVLPIQLSHFYAVDTILAFFVLLTIYRLLELYEKPDLKNSIFVGISFGFALATKISAVVLISSIGLSLIVDFLFIFLKNPHRPHIWFPHVPKFLKRLFIDGVFVIGITMLTYLILEPYALIDYQTFIRQNLEQYNMTHDAFTFPYSLQYVDKTPYLYELKNIFFWGLGPLLATLGIAGTLFITFQTLRRKLNSKFLILNSFFWGYFITVGNFAIGFMRYMLPLYPFLCLFAALLIWKILQFFKHKFPHQKFLIFNFKFLILLALLAWPLSFINIYTQPNTRTLATDWINQNIPIGSSIATEHWDDGLPIGTQSNYRVYELPMYEFDENPIKWQKVNLALANADYIIIASNRLYVPLQKLTDCEKLPPGRCYAKTAKYYKDLFNENLGFKKIQEFKIQPKFSIFNFQFSIDDSFADESFTVYDHPKVIIFKREK